MFIVHHNHGIAIVRIHPVQLMYVEWCQMAADPLVKPAELGHEYACRLPESAPTITKWMNVLATQRYTNLTSIV